MRDIDLIRNTKDLLVRRHIVALVILASLISLAYLSLNILISRQQSIAAEINISGRQRMLSQRIALHAQNIVKSVARSQRESYRLDLVRSLNQFEDAHMALTLGNEKMGIPKPDSRTILDMYFADREWGLDAQVRSFIKLARQVSIKKVETITPDDPNFNRVWYMATIFLLPKLDEAVRVYQSEGEKKIKTLGAMQTAIWVLALLVLIGEGGLIFWPLVRQVGGILDYLVMTKRDLNEALNKAESANRLKSEFLSNTSHELRTPLNAIIGISDVLLEDAKAAGDQDLTEPLTRINKASHHLLRLINDILDYSKLQVDELELHVEDIDVIQIMDNLKSKALHLAQRNNNTLIFNEDQNIGKIRGDMLRIRQVLFNLIENACKFTHQGTITVSASRIGGGNGDIVKIAVKDTGVGIPEDKVATCFDVFSQMDASFKRAYEGAGMGLAISRQLARLMGGDITVVSQPGKGAEFTLTLPVEIAHD